MPILRERRGALESWGAVGQVQGLCWRQRETEMSEEMEHEGSGTLRIEAGTGRGLGLFLLWVLIHGDVTGVLHSCPGSLSLQC